MSELRDRLERLAGRGTPRGADEVLHAAMRGVPANEVDSVPDDNVSDLPIIDDDAVPMVTAEVEPRSRSRHARRGVRRRRARRGRRARGRVDVRQRRRRLARRRGAPARRRGLARGPARGGRRARRRPRCARCARASSNVTHRAADLKIVNDASAPLAGVDLVGRPPAALDPAARRRVRQGDGRPAASSRRARTRRRCRSSCRTRCATPTEGLAGEGRAREAGRRRRPADVRRDRASRRPLVREPGVHRARVRA